MAILAILVIFHFGDYEVLFPSFRVDCGPFAVEQFFRAQHIHSGSLLFRTTRWFRSMVPALSEFHFDA